MDINRLRAKRPAKSYKGSITVEACISLPVFLCFFLALAFFIRIAVINITLNHVVNESVKQLAAASYPLKFLNELEDELVLENPDYELLPFDEELKEVRDAALEDIKDSAGEKLQGLLPDMLSGNISREEIEGVFLEVVALLKQEAAGKVVEDVGGGIGKFLAQKYSQQYFEAKAQAKYAAAGYLIQKFLKASDIDNSRMEYLLVMLPQSDAEMEMRSADPSYLEVSNQIGFVPDKDDVVIAIQYKTVIPLPFFGRKEVLIRKTAVEQAWMNGSNGVYAMDLAAGDEQRGNDEASKAENSVEDSYKKLKESTVFITRTGSRYHKDGCIHLKRSKIPIKLSQAQKKGMLACKACYEGFKIENVRGKKNNLK